MRSDVADMMNASTAGKGGALLRRPLPAGVRRRGAVGAPRHRRGRRRRHGPRRRARQGRHRLGRAAPGGARPVAVLSFDLSDEHRLFRDDGQGVRGGGDRAAGRGARPRGPVPARPGRQAAELGLMGIPIPAEWEGAGADTLAYAIAIEELARVDQSFAITVAAHTSLGTQPINLFGTDEQKRRWLPQLASGQAAGRVRPDRARGRLRRGRHPHHGAPGGRRVGRRRVEDVHHERRHRDLGARDGDRPHRATTRSRTS